MRGQKVFNEIIRSSSLAAPLRRGRSSALVTKRNECLIARYYYYGYYKNKCYEDIIRLLTAEFFLSPTTIAAIIQTNSEMLHAIKQRSPVLYYLQSHWPHMRW